MTGRASPVLQGREDVKDDETAALDAAVDHYLAWAEKREEKS